MFLKNIFGKKKIDLKKTRKEDIKFLGKVEGNGLSQLKLELISALKSFDFIINVYIIKVKYSEDEKIRIALIIDVTTHNDKIGMDLANACSEIISFDIFIYDKLSITQQNYIKENSTKLYNKNYKLFECCIMVDRGTDSKMPEHWNSAIVYYYIGASDYKSALLKACEYLRIDGYVYKGIFNDKVSQIEFSEWNIYVSDRWSQHIDFFPSQDEIKNYIIGGCIFCGPVLELE
jgi:hypothetical protein